MKDNNNNNLIKKEFIDYFKDSNVIKNIEDINFIISAIGKKNEFFENL